MSDSQRLSDEDVSLAASVRGQHGSTQAAANALGWTRSKMRRHLHRAAERGLLPPGKPTMPGYAIKSLTETPNGIYVKQTKEAGEDYQPTAGLVVRGKTTLVNAEGRVAHQYIMERADAEAQVARMRAIVDGMKDEIAPAPAVEPPALMQSDLLSMYVVTDMHLGALAWNEETGGGDYDLSLGEKLVVDWFGVATDMAPPSGTAVLAQLGDFLHYDSFKSVTPESGHQLDADSRYPKMVRAAIRALRQIVAALLAKHAHVHIIMADANHDPAGEVWLREMFAVLYEREPRVSVDTSPGTYLVYEFGDVALFLHHGHRRNMNQVAPMFAGRFREIYGRTRFAYAHVGHKHSDELKTTDLMKVEQHETLAAPDAYGSNWLSGRSAKVIHYHRHRGEVGRNIITAEMVADASGSGA